MLNNKLIHNSIILLSNRPNVNGSALLLRVYSSLNASGGILCISNRRSSKRLGLHTRELSIGNGGLFVLARAGVRGVLRRTGGVGPSIVVTSSIRAVCSSEVDSTPNDVAGIGRITVTFVTGTGSRSVSMVLIKRVGGRNDVTNPGILRRVISTILDFRNSGGRACHVVHTGGGHCNSAGRVNIFRVASGKLHRITGPSRVLLTSHPASASNGYTIYAVRNAHPVITRVRTLIAPAAFPTPHHASGNVSCGHGCLVLTILRGQLNLHFSGGSFCLGIVNNLRVGRATSSLNVTLTLVSSLASAIVPSDLVTVNRLKLTKRYHNVTGIRLHIGRTTHLKFSATIVPTRGGGTIGMSKVRVVTLGGMCSLLGLLGGAGARKSVGGRGRNCWSGTCITFIYCSTFAIYHDLLFF